MLCRNCGIEIADKAIVCYRCGQGTTDPVRKPVAIVPRRGPLIPLGIITVLVVISVYMFNVSRTAANPELPQLAAGLALGVAVALLVRTVLQRR